ncbi:MAG: succinylglutamate desuccinylase/aspartoacylase family protein [Bacteroidales bacterium]|nr:succinylglutamate desuccinylase/aspartoacylase family protein [Bacteroidales bacterium]
MKLLLIFKNRIDCCNKSLIPRFAIFIIICSLYSISIIAQTNKPFSIMSIEAEPGKKTSGTLTVEDGIDQGTIIPLTIVNGRNPGPVLTVFAGIHGTEYVPVIVLQELAKEINPEELAGTLVLVHIANVPAFSGRSVYSSPVDNKNLNRVFPGKQDGSISERIAWVLTNELIKGSDYFIDAHGGEFNEQLVDYLYFYYGCPDTDLCKKSLMLAKAIGNKYLIPEKYTPDDGTPQATYSDLIAIRLGIPTITLEWGDRGKVEHEKVDFAKKGLNNVMRALGMLEGEVITFESQVYLLDEKFIISEHNGIVYTFVKKGQYVTKGTLIGYVSDYHGNLIEEYHSPIDGIIVTVTVAPAINKDNTIYRVARPANSFDF